jgi:rhodanese-related sulfurtransferase
MIDLVGAVECSGTHRARRCTREGAHGMKHHSPGFVKLCESVRKGIRELSIHDVKRKLDRGEVFHLIDVREESEWAKDHLPRAEYLGKGIIERDIEVRIPDQNAEIVLYCGGGYRSALATDNLQKMGYTNIFSMNGGYRGWTEANLPLEKTK